MDDHIKIMHNRINKRGQDSIMRELERTYNQAKKSHTRLLTIRQMQNTILKKNAQIMNARWAIKELQKQVAELKSMVYLPAAPESGNGGPPANGPKVS